MSRSFKLAAALIALFSLPLANSARAGVGDEAGGALAALKNRAPIEQAQYYSFDDSDYCWYDGGWQGPGWYVCGNEWDDGLGWGGPYGWNGWGGGRHIRHHLHGVGDWHGQRPNHAPAAASQPGAPANPYLASGGQRHLLSNRRLGAHTQPQVGGGALHHDFQGGAPGLPGVSIGSGVIVRPPGGVVSPGFRSGAAPVMHGFGGGGLHTFGGGGGSGGFHSFGGGGGGFRGFGGGGGGGGFHVGGGGAFTGGGHGGHR